MRRSPTGAWQLCARAARPVAGPEARQAGRQPAARPAGARPTWSPPLVLSSSSIHSIAMNAGRLAGADIDAGSRRAFYCKRVRGDVDGDAPAELAGRQAGNGSVLVRRTAFLYLICWSRRALVVVASRSRALSLSRARSLPLPQEHGCAVLRCVLGRRRRRGARTRDSTWRASECAAVVHCSRSWRARPRATWQGDRGRAAGGSAGCACAPRTAVAGAGGGGGGPSTIWLADVWPADRSTSAVLAVTAVALAPRALCRA
jgi:hypothetical protein